MLSTNVIVSPTFFESYISNRLYEFLYYKLEYNLFWIFVKNMALYDDRKILLF